MRAASSPSYHYDLGPRESRKASSVPDEPTFGEYESKLQQKRLQLRLQPAVVYEPWDA